jgi:predicted phage replisome organizer
MADVKWIKIVTDVFDDEKILMIETMPECDTIIVIWFKLLCLAGKQNNGGVFQMGQIPYTDEMFAAIFRRPINTVRLALNTFERFNMIEIIRDTVTIPNWGKHQSLDAYEKKKVRDRERMAKKRAEQKALIETSPDKSPNKSPDVASLEEDKERDIEEDKDIYISPGNTARKKPSKHKHGEFQKVLLTDEEYFKLGDDYGAANRDKAISFLDAYIAEKGYKSKSHNLAIRRWVMDAIADSQRRPQATQPKQSAYMDSIANRVTNVDNW